METRPDGGKELSNWHCWGMTSTFHGQGDPDPSQEGVLLPIPDPAESARLLHASAAAQPSATASGFRSGFVALIGRPNVGKSTLLNQLVGEKVAITSPVAQTTRNRLRAILTTPSAQLVLLDTPVPMRPDLTRKDKALIKLAEFRRKGPGYLREWMQSRKEWAEMQRWTSTAPEATPHNQKIEAAFRDALPHLQLRRYDGRTALFRPPLDRHWQVSGGRWVSQAREYVSHDNDWGAWIPSLTVHEVPGDHDSMVLEPNVRVMATTLNTLLAEAES
jgi:hypothetical protein